jgi:hypothetical protein
MINPNNDDEKSNFQCKLQFSEQLTQPFDAYMNLQKFVNLQPIQG